MSLNLALGAGLAGCGAPSQPDKARERPETEDGAWLAAPRVTSVTPQTSGGVLVRGEAAPRARVILSGGDGDVMAAGADERGRFELPVAAAAIGRVLTPEIQSGQSTTPGPQRLLLAGDAGALAALLFDGGPSLRLTPGPALDVLDGDGRGLLASGRATPGARVVVRAGDGSANAVADTRGRWSAVVPAVGDQATEVEIDGRSFRYPGAGPSTGRAERTGDGWRVTRPLSGAARQTSWFPDAAG